MNELHNRFVASVMAPAITGQRYQGWTPCIVWCEKHIGDGWWFIGDGVFEFVDDVDRTMFMLRWG
jgi:hypothetical protein